MERMKSRQTTVLTVTAILAAGGALVMVGCAVEGSPRGTQGRGASPASAELGNRGALPAPSTSGSALGSNITLAAERPSRTDERVAPVRPSADTMTAHGTTSVPLESSLPTAGAPLVRTEPWRFGDAAGTILISPHYRLHTTMTDPRILGQLPTLMEAALAHYTTALGDLPWPDVPLQSFIFDRRSEWADHTQDRLGSSAGPYLGLGRGGYTTGAESVFFNIGREDTFTIAVHEGWHQYTQQVFADQLPVWLEEGVAAYMEGSRFRRDAERPVFLPWRNFERYGELRDAVRTGRLLSLDELIDGNPQRFLSEGRATLLTYYAQVWALVHFLIDGADGRYRDSLHQVIADAAHGRMIGRLVSSDAVPRGAARRLVGQGRHGRLLAQEYFSRDLAAMSSEYDAFLRQIVSSGSAARIWRGQNPIEP